MTWLLDLRFARSKGTSEVAFITYMFPQTVPNVSALASGSKKLLGELTMNYQFVSSGKKGSAQWRNEFLLESLRVAKLVHI